MKPSGLPYRHPSPPPPDPPEPKVPAKVRARAWFKDNANSPKVKLVFMACLLGLFSAVGLAITAYEPITHHGEIVDGIARLGISAFIGFTICMIMATIFGFCYMISEILGDLLKGIARRL
jgi:hypothetical protein